jgi:hypothetical protein
LSHLIRVASRLARVTAVGVVVAGLSASGALAAGTLTIEPEQVDFGTNAFGSSVTKTFVATNSGPDPVVLSEVALLGGVDPFDFVAGSCEPDTLVGVGETCGVEVVFSPIGFQAASYQALLSVAGGEEDASATALLTGATQSVTPLTATPTTLSADGTPRTRPGTYSSDFARPVPSPRKPSPQWPVEIRLGDLTDAVPALIRGGPSRARLLPVFEAGEAGRLNVTVFGWKGARRLGIGSGKLDFPVAQSGRLRLRLNKKGRALLRRPQRTRIKVVVKFEPRQGATSRQGPEYFVKAPAKKRKRR